MFINATKTVTRTAAQLVTAPLKVAGAWIGGEAAVSGLMDEALDDLLPSFTRIRLLPRQLALAAIRYCCVPLIQHWLRTHPPAVVRAPAARFDSWILTMVAGIAELPSLSATAAAIVGLPLREGGLGCLPQRTIAPLAYAASLVTAITSIAKRAEWRAELFELAHNTTIPDTHLLDWLKSTAPRSIMLVSKLLDKRPEDIWDCAFSTVGLQRNLTAEWAKDQATEVLLSLDTPALQARFLDQASRIGKGWLAAVPSSDRRTRCLTRRSAWYCACASTVACTPTIAKWTPGSVCVPLPQLTGTRSTPWPAHTAPPGQPATYATRM